MNDIDNEKAILSEPNDFEHQAQILREEHNQEVQKRRWYIMISTILFCIVLVFFVSYSYLYAYRPYGQKDSGHHINVDTDGDHEPDTNITDDNDKENHGNHNKDNNKDKDKHQDDNNKDKDKHDDEPKDKVPKYNIDYFQNLKALFNYDVYGDKSVIFNKVNQMDENNLYCKLNCDRDNDGWPDYNIDINGDGQADLNIVLDPTSNSVCDINCDLNFDTIPDTNIDIDNDLNPDINITEGDYRKPIYNIDYMGNRTPIFNIKSENGIKNKVNDATNNKTCKTNCDLDGDGWPDYNIILDEDNSSNVINELIKTSNLSLNDYSRGKTVDWKCFKDDGTAINCVSGSSTTNLYINIDVDGDGQADINISDDKGETLINNINKSGQNNGKTIILNRDTDNDGFPNYDIDVNNDGIPDINITDGKNDKCIKNCDTNYDGIPDYLIDITSKGNPLISISNLNVDKNYDGQADINIDLDYDLYPDLNIDLDGDGVADLNIDFDHDGIPDFNIDTDGDGKPDMNLDPYGIGICAFNCDTNGIITNPVDTGELCSKNCDTDKDGWPDQSIDIDNDGLCDYNCDGKIDDKNFDYYKDNEYKNYNVEINFADENSKLVYIENPLDINASDIEPGWYHTYELIITNNTTHAIDYKLLWQKVINEFTTSNMRYYLTYDNTSFINDLVLPTSDVIINDKITLKRKSSAKITMYLEFYNETNINQIYDAGKSFKGQLTIDIKE